MGKEEIRKLAHDRGFTLWAIIGGITYQFMDDIGINLFVNTTDENFKMMYLVPHSIFRLECPDCSPFGSNTHFEKLYRKFRKEVVECWGHLT